MTLAKLWNNSGDRVNLTDRQREIVEMVKIEGLLTGNEIADKLGLSRATIRSDLSILTMMNILGARPRVGYFYTGKTEVTLLTERVRQITIESTMSLPVVVDVNTTIYDAIVSMFLENVGTLYITEGGYLKGVVSRKDMLRSTISRDDLTTIPVAMVMSRMPNIHYVFGTDSVLEGARKIFLQDIDGLPVVEEENGKLKVIGRFTKTNIVKLFDEIFEGE